MNEQQRALIWAAIEAIEEATDILEDRDLEGIHALDLSVLSLSEVIADLNKLVQAP